MGCGLQSIQMTIGRPCPCDCPAGLVELRENYGFPSRELSRILDVLTANLKDLCRAWEHIHGIA